MEKKFVYAVVSEYTFWDDHDIETRGNGTRIDAVCESLETAKAYVEVLIGKYCDNYSIDAIDITDTFGFEHIERTDRDVCLHGYLYNKEWGHGGYDPTCKIIIRVDEIELMR